MGEWLDFSGKVCVVTGSGGGIGEAIARSFAAAGGHVALLDLKADEVRTIAEEIVESGGKAMGVAVDVSDPDSVDAAVAAVEGQFGAADILVNNAGFIRFDPLENIAARDWTAMMDVNLRGYLLCAQGFGKAMLQRGRGVMVHTASVAAQEPHPYCSAYGPSKAAVLALNEQMTLEWGPRGIRTNCVSPGLTRTPLSEPFYAQPEVFEGRRAAVPIGIIANPQDIANAVLFLASERARYICGANLIVDGGLSLTSMLRVPRPNVV